MSVSTVLTAACHTVNQMIAAMCRNGDALLAWSRHAVHSSVATGHA